MEWELLTDQPLWQKLIKKGFWLYFFTILIAPAGYVIKVIISNKMSIEDVGLFYSIIGLIFIISLYNDLGLTEALQYFLPKYRLRKEYNNVKTLTILTWIVQLVTWIIIAWGLYLGADRLAIHYFHTPEAAHIIKLLCFYFFWINFIQVFMSFFIAFQDTVNQNLVEFIRMYTTLIFVLIFLCTNSITLNNFTYARLIGIWMSIITGIIIFFSKYSHVLKLGKYDFKTDLIKKQIKYARWVFLWANIGTIFRQINQQIIMYTLWAQQAGYITNFRSLFYIFNYIIAPLSIFLFPILTEMIEKKEEKKVVILQSLLYKYLLLFSFMFWWFFLVFWPETALILFWKKFIYSGVLFSYTAPFLFLSCIYSISFAMLGAMGMVKTRVKILWIWLLLNIVIAYLLIRYTSLASIWSIIGLLVWRWVIATIALKHIYKKYKFTIDYRFLAKNILFIVWLMVVFYLTKNHYFILENGMRYRNILTISIYLLIFVWIIWLINYKEIWLFIKEINTFRQKNQDDKNIKNHQKSPMTK